MFGSPVIDLVIYLSFVYFIGSLILSAISEAISGTLRLRQKDLSKGLYRLFFDPQWRLFVRQTLLKSPHLQSLMKSKGRWPAYIPARNFVLALLEQVDEAEFSQGRIVPLNRSGKPVGPTAEQDRAGRAGQPVAAPSAVPVEGKAVLPPDVVRVMRTIMMRSQCEKVEDRIAAFEKGMEEFYNNTMDRVTGWYKRRIRRILLVVALVLAVALNLDTIKIANDALKDPEKLGKAVDNIVANMPRLDSLQHIITVNDSAVTDSVVHMDSIMRTAQGKVKQLMVTYQQTSGYSLGYGGKFGEEWKRHFWSKLAGVIITAFALQLGSNYWFDLMNRAVNVRAVGKKPGENGNRK